MSFDIKDLLYQMEIRDKKRLSYQMEIRDKKPDLSLIRATFLQGQAEKKIQELQVINWHIKSINMWLDKFDGMIMSQARQGLTSYHIQYDNNIPMDVWKCIEQDCIKTIQEKLDSYKDEKYQIKFDIEIQNITPPFIRINIKGIFLEHLNPLTPII